MTTITPFLWFEGRVREAVERYLEIFEDAELLETTPGPDDDYFVATMHLHGVRFSILAGGPDHVLSEAFSLAVAVDTQEEVDRLWDLLLEGGGRELACGWLTDRFGLTWQVLPTGLPAMLTSSDREAAQRTSEVMMTMNKLDLAQLQAAYEGR